jgi:hypothetical protein
MSANKKSTDDSWDPDTAPEIPDDVWDWAQISVGGKVIREATGTLTRRGRPPVGDEPKRQVTLRLAPKVIDYFKQGGEGWQTRLNEALERYVVRESASGRRTDGAKRPAPKRSARAKKG